MARINHRRECQSEEALTLQIRQSFQELASLEKRRKKLLFSLCRTLRAAPGYKLHPSELAAEIVGDLSCLSQESYAVLMNRMVRESPSRTSR